MTDLSRFLSDCQNRVEKTLEQLLPPAQQLPTKLHEAMRYSTLNGGKRIRPSLAYAAAQACGGELALADAPAAALEFIHAYSLIHDDLPAMDDDALRRGQPTCHIQFDEATAILAGDALQTLAFQTLCEAPGLSNETKLAMLRSLAIASGSQGMVGGQSIDLSSEGQSLTLPELESLHLFKTGALIEASILMGALSANVHNEDELQAFRSYARCIGLAFQVKDDILDIEGDTVTLGKQQGADSQHHKATYPALLGLEGAKAKCAQLHELALQSLRQLPDRQTQRLEELSLYIISRNH